MPITRALGWPLHTQVSEWWFSPTAPLLNTTVSRPDYLDFSLAGVSETCSAHDTTTYNLAQLESSKSKEQLQKTQWYLLQKCLALSQIWSWYVQGKKQRKRILKWHSVWKKNFWVALYNGVHLIFMWLLPTEQIFVTSHITGTHPANRTGKKAMWHHNFQIQTQHKNGWNSLA